MQPDPHAQAHALSARSPGQLLEDMRWLRGLASALVGPAGADDVVQDTLQVALSRSEPVHELRPFLAGVARRVATRVRRSDRRRKQREQRSAQRQIQLRGLEVHPTTDELAERVDLARVVLEELRELPPTRQRMVMLRYLEGLEPADIARREGARPATVRANLSKGLGELRERLDRRQGGRDAWCMVLVPWLAAESSLQQVAATATSTKFVGVLALMTTSTLGKLSLVLIPALVTLALWNESLRGPELQRLPSASRGDEVVELASIEAPELEPVTQGRISLGGRGESPGSEVSSASEARAVRLVDAVTGESVPEFSLVLSGQQEVTRTSDTEGVLHLPELPDRESVYVIEEERPSGAESYQRSARHRMPWPLPEQVAVHVGPTFRLAFDVPGALEVADLEARFEETHSRERQHRAPVRIVEGGLPWVRFPYGVTTLAGPGPWSLNVSDSEGHWRASAEVTRKAGVEPLPVPLTFEGFGAARFEIDRDAAPISQLLTLELEAMATGEVRRVQMIDHEDGPNLRGHARFLEAGTYTWHMNGCSAPIEIEVARTTHVELATLGIAPVATFDATVRLDVSAGTEISPEQLRVYVVKGDGLDSGFATHAVPDPADPEQSWLVELKDLTPGEWFVSPSFVGEDRRFEPPFASVVPDGDLPVLQLLDLGEAVMVTVRVVDQSGQSIRGAEVAHDAGGFPRTYVNPDGRGGLLRAGLPSATRNRVHVRAPGHCYRMVHHRPDQDGDKVEIVLQPGWCNVISVLDLTTQSAVAGVGVLVDGREVGVTDEAGQLTIEGEGPPDVLEIRSEGREVVAGRLEQGDDPLGGWLFVTRRNGETGR